MSDVRPELHQLALALENLTWSEVTSMAVQLRVDFSKLEQIRQEKSDHSSRLLSAMDTWLKTDPGASWKKVINALRATNKNVLALELERKYCNAIPPAATVTQPAPPTYPVAPSASMATEDVTLSPDSAVDLLEELLEVQTHSRFLGLKLGVAEYIVNGIDLQYTNPRDRLYYVLVEFLKQVEPRPTWRAIVDALNSRTINLPRLALKIESEYCLPAQTQPQSAGSNSPRSLTSTPTMPDLLNFKTQSDVIKILQEIGTHHTDLGTMLLNDNTGALTQGVVSQHQRNPVEINRAILTRWLQGQGKKPVQWSTLIEVLKDIELSELAQKIKDNL